MRYRVYEEAQLADVKYVRQLLTSAPADRAWRRPGYLVLCRAHPDRMQQVQDISSVPIQSRHEGPEAVLSWEGRKQAAESGQQGVAR